MVSPESASKIDPNKMSMIKKFLESLKRYFSHKKVFEEIKKESEKSRHQRAHHETKEERDREESRRAEKDKTRKYHEARSAEINEAEVSLARFQRAEAVKRKMANIIDHIEPEAPGAGYIVDVVRRNTSVQNALQNLISESPSGAEVVNNLLTTGTDLHGSSIDLIKQAQRLSYEAGNVSSVNFTDLSELFAAISQRAKQLIVEEVKINQKGIARRGSSGQVNALDILERESGIVMTDAEKNNLNQKSEEDWYNAIDSLIMTRREMKPDVADWIQQGAAAPSHKVASEIVAPVDEIWGELQRRETSKEGKLSVDDLKEFDVKIREAETSLYPKDVPARSEAYNKAVQGIKAYTEEKLNILAKKAAEILQKEGPPLQEGIMDPEKFLKEIVLNKGRLGGLFGRNPVMEQLFYGTGPESGRFREMVFLKIHSAVISDQRNSSHDNFGLYERADFTTFIDLLRVGLGKQKSEKTGETLGKAWADYFNNLSNAVRQLRDIDFWASQPGATSENYNKSLAMLQNEYTYAAMGIPAVTAAFRAYEVALRSITSSNDGYIPAKMIEYDSRRMGSFWDQRAKEMVRNWIAMGSVPDLYRNPVTYFHQVEADGHSLRTTDDNGQMIRLQQPSEDELSMYMVLAKGIGMTSIRFLEMFAQGRVPGSQQPEKGIEAFHSMPYEGIAKSLNYMNMYINKWKIGSYKFYHLFNMLVPDEKRIKKIPNDSSEAIKVFMAYQDGTFEDKYGPDAKRFLDMMNFSGISSALGRDTLWRQYGSTLNWSDRQRESLGGPTQLVLTERFATEALKNFLVVGRYREQYRQEIIKRNKDEAGVNLPVSGAGFEKLWQEHGQDRYKGDIAIEWDKLLGKDPKKGIVHTPLAEKSHHLLDAYQNAFKARVWVEMAMRNPLVVAHSLKIDVPRLGTEGTRKTRLHNILVQEILGIPPEDTKYGEMYGKTAFGASPTDRQEQYMIEVLNLEGDLAAVREKAINECRDLTTDDFNIIGDQARRNNAISYWEKVRQAILGTDNIEQAEKLYEKFGLQLSGNGEDYVWDYEKIHRIEETLKDLEHNYKEGVTTIKGEDGRPIVIPLLLKKAVEMKPEWILGTDDMNMGKMDWLNLGSKQWLRRGGDIASHEAGGSAFTKYLVDGLTPSPDKVELIKILKDLRNGYMGDMIEAGWSVAANLAYMTDRLYAWDWKRLGSAAELDVWKTRRGVSAWLANARREWWDKLEHADILPPHDHFYAYNVPGKADIHSMRKLTHAENADVWKEFLTLGIGLALAITIWKGLTTRSEEEEGGGGGGGHH